MYDVVYEVLYEVTQAYDVDNIVINTFVHENH